MNIMNWYKIALDEGAKRGGTFVCPECGTKQLFLGDEWAGECECGFDPNKPEDCENCDTPTEDLQEFWVQDFPYSKSFGYLCHICFEKAQDKQAVNPWKSPNR